MESIDEAELVRLYRDERISLVDIARRFGRGTALIRQCLEARGVRIRTAWGRRAAVFNLEQARRLYVDEGLTLEQIGAALGCSMTTVYRRLVAAGIARREGGKTLYDRVDFSGSLTEKAYLIGFRIGDLHLALEGGRTIVVKCTTTRQEQLDLFRELFSPYGHVYSDEAGLAGRMRQSIGMQVALNLTFEFLLEKHKAVPQWILESDEPFFAFLAGYIDAEGYFRTYRKPNQSKPLACLELRSYDAVLLAQLGDGLNARGVRCAPACLRVHAGYTNREGVRSNQDLWGLGVHRRISLRQLITLLDPYVRHARRRRDMLKVLDVC